jgi:hypothetical protein
MGSSAVMPELQQVCCYICACTLGLGLFWRWRVDTSDIYGYINVGIIVMKILVGLVISISLVLSGCGGAEDLGGQVPSTDAVKVTIQGVAAMGAPMAGAIIVAVDATGAEVCRATAGPEGAYSCVLSAQAKSPLVLSATNGDVTYYAPLAEFKSGTVNLTKLTTLIAAQLSPTGEPAYLAAQIKDGSAKISVAALKQKTDDLRAALQPLLTNAGNDIDPISGKFSADGTGHDKALMALDVLIKPTNGKSNINVTVKTEFTIGTELPAITFASGETPPKLAAAVASVKLPASDEDMLIANFMRRANDCYALPKLTRVSSDHKNVIASECRGLFPADEPNNYKDDGNLVGPTGAFSGLFSDAATGVLFTRPEVEFRFPGDEIRLRFSFKLKSGSENFQRLRLKRYANSFRALGNQYDYRFWVRPWTEMRPLVNRDDLSYYSTGFNVYVKDALNDEKLSKFTKVVVTPPKYCSIELFPSSALDFLVIKVNGVQTNTNNLRIAGSFKSSPGTFWGKKIVYPRELSEILPWERSEKLIWAPSPSLMSGDCSPSLKSGDWSDADIDGIPESARWRADFFLKDGSVVTQYYETTIAPLTIPELKSFKWAELTASTLNDFLLKSRGTSTGYVAFPSGFSSYPVTWTLDPNSAFAPNTIQITGFWPNIKSEVMFNDTQEVLRTDRNTTVICKPQTKLDTHCETNSEMYNIALFATNARDMLIASDYWSYKFP